MLMSGPWNIDVSGQILLKLLLGGKKVCVASCGELVSATFCSCSLLVRSNEGADSLKGRKEKLQFQ